MRSDAQKNYEHLLAVAREVVTEQGANASLRDVARKAGVGLGTLYRHFPTREALLETLLRSSFDALTERAAELEASSSSEEALVSWTQSCIAGAHEYRGAISLMVAAIEDPQSALHDSCVALKTSGARLLARAQADGVARADLASADLFALISALAWLNDQPSFAPRAEHLFDVVSSAILPKRTSNNSGKRRMPTPR